MSLVESNKYMLINQESVEEKPQAKRSLSWVWEVLLLVVLALGGYYRYVGIDWAISYNLHPDERFFTWVETGIAPVSSVSEYFDTAKSTLNPNNRGFGFFVYGTLPLFIVQYTGVALGKTGWGDFNIIGREMSAGLDLLTVLIVYLIGNRLYKKAHLGLIAAAFYAFSVLPIQYSHYFLVDTFTNFFGMLAFYFAVHIQTAEPSEVDYVGDVKGIDQSLSWLTHGWKSFIPYALFGLFLGMATASKVNAAVLAITLPIGACVYYLRVAPEKRQAEAAIIIRNIVLAAIFSVLVFRILQPYAFDGPSFFNVGLSQEWISTLTQLSSLQSGNGSYPPETQWARRPLTFSLTNMVNWGLGWPLGLLVWAGFLWMAWRMLNGKWKDHLVLWTWTGFYFALESLNFSSTMRYQLLVYPTLGLIGAWALVDVWEEGQRLKEKLVIKWGRVLKITAAVVGSVVIVGTAAWAFAFTRIYTRPITRIEASQWIYQNVPGPIDLEIQNGSNVTNMPVSYPLGLSIPNGAPVQLSYKAQDTGILTGIDFSHIVETNYTSDTKTLQVTITDSSQNPPKVVTGQVSSTFIVQGSDPRGDEHKITLDEPLPVKAGNSYAFVFSVAESGKQLSIAGPTTVAIVVGNTTVADPLPEPVTLITKGAPLMIQFTPIADGSLSQIDLNRVVDWLGTADPKTLQLTISSMDGSGSPASVTEVTSVFGVTDDPRGNGYTAKLSTPIALDKTKNYTLELSLKNGDGALAVYGSRQANESDWDDPLPYGMMGYGPFDYYNGVYRTDLDFQMYWDDNADKLARFESTLQQADYIFISSSRQWGSVTRIPEMYPLTTYYYRALIGCPQDKDIYWCYSVAKPGMFQGQLGYELVDISQSNPNLGPIQFNDQFAEEAFTVYDHPKVLIFKKTSSYNAQQVRSLLGSVDLSHVIDLTPKQATDFKGDLLMSANEITKQQAGGTWSELFDVNAIQNKYPGVGVVIWYLVITLLGWIVYPFVRLALGKLRDHGYPFTKLVGLLLLALVVWLAGSEGIPVYRSTIAFAVVGLLIVNGVLAWFQREELIAEIKTNWKHYLMIEAVGLAFFVAFLLVRLGNPDLWHPSKGGEKPMDFSYFNAILKSTYFPPYDPWYANGYINYYYYGFVIVGMPVKLLGIVPSIAYNFILPTLYSMVALGAFCVGFNLTAAFRSRIAAQPEETPNDTLTNLTQVPFFGGIISAISILVLGNLGTLRMIWEGLQKLAANGVSLDQAGFFERFIWTFEGLAKFIGGQALPYGPGDWYWIPSRAIPGEPITEFPSFTFLYADPHAHMIALPVTILVIGIALAILLGRWQWGDREGHVSWLHVGATFLLAGIAIGALRPTNTWDWPTYLALTVVAVVYTGWRYGSVAKDWLSNLSPTIKKLLMMACALAALVGMTVLLYEPFTRWYAQGYNNIDPWTGDHTPVESYLVHWGLFLFLITSWMLWEVRDWLANTPASKLQVLRPYQGLIIAAFIVYVGLIVVLLYIQVHIAWIVLPLLALAGVLIFRPGQPDVKRAVLFMIGTALALTLAVELIVIRGDIGRMNTVFKFYMQAWTLFSLSAAASFIWLYSAVTHAWGHKLRVVWQVALVFLVASAAFFPLTAATDKIRDRMTVTAPHTLDGMEYMNYSTYSQNGKDMDLSQDYRAIKWMQQNVQGSPVIVEANATEYTWGSRFTIYTGLPGVVGWNWHQRQQRGVVDADWVQQRVDEVGAFYNSVDQTSVEAFLQRYGVKYIIVGQLEESMYTAEGIAKFAQWNGMSWHQVYHDEDTYIYEVNTTN
jgi:YYY domain-containing protein